MATFLLPAGASEAGPRKRALYCVVLADIIRAAADAKYALETAVNLLSGHDGHHFSKYDAHVGDTGCHIRATMLIVAFDHMRSTALEADNQPVPSWLRDAIAQLSAIRTNAELLCSDLTKNHKDPRTMNLGSKRDYPGKIVTLVLGHESTVEQPFATPCHCSDEAAWKPQDPKMLIRFLVYCHVLSKYKRFSVTKDGGRCRLSTELAADESQRLSAPYWDRQNNDYTLPKSARVLAELTALQRWLSKVSCDWLQTVSQTTTPESIYSRVVCTSFKESRKGIASAACFPTFLLLCSLWVESFGTIILLDRHFCPQGWHFNVFRCDLRHVDETPARGVLRPTEWKVQEMSLESLRQHQDGAAPVIVMMGNSIDGDNSDYTARVLAKETGCPKSRSHKEHHCAENSQHVAKFLSSDHNLLAMSFFAAHRQYAFRVEDCNSDADVIQRLMGKMHQHAKAPAFHSMWMKLRADANVLGASKANLAIIGWQHVFAESRMGLARLVEKWLLDENLMILSS